MRPAGQHVSAMQLETLELNLMFQSQQVALFLFLTQLRCTLMYSGCRSTQDASEHVPSWAVHMGPLTHSWACNDASLLYQAVTARPSYT